jgi:hypothetical protein
MNEKRNPNGWRGWIDVQPFWIFQMQVVGEIERGRRKRECGRLRKSREDKPVG